MYWAKYTIGLRELCCTPFYLAEDGLCMRPRDFHNRLPNVALVNFGHPLPPLMVEQTPTALLVDALLGMMHLLCACYMRVTDNFRCNFHA